MIGYLLGGRMLASNRSYKLYTTGNTLYTTGNNEQNHCNISLVDQFSSECVSYKIHSHYSSAVILVPQLLAVASARISAPS